ncbi:LytR/AlgR family response regulator transcription factor [Xanthovirga aplysinae]|uniref:LytR/AlgR family response regulator transcription factor n=1 Tax=Xanthovirga aplysinae TaxID=2529853 RepID=UPI0012BB863F|nr:LytTR family transcriptional regulator DNA-binding domain-containing protein [Xanthovirga aplysinae]MTI33640.1 response regulator transcription factor [Xanthovirga aplysinae]
MENLKVLIVEDELIIAEDMQMMLEQLGYSVTGIAISYTEAIKILEFELPDIVMVDINLKGKETGIDLARTINERFEIPFIFITSNMDRMTIDEAKLTQPSSYLLKPFKAQHLYAAIEVALSNTSEGQKQENKEPDENAHLIKDSLFVKKNHHFVKIKIEDIYYIKADGNYLEIICEEEKFLIRSTLKNFMNRLPVSDFFQTHKSYIVNLNFVEALSSNYVLILEEEVPLSRNSREMLLERTQRFS